MHATQIASSAAASAFVITAEGVFSEFNLYTEKKTIIGTQYVKTTIANKQSNSARKYNFNCKTIELVPLLLLFACLVYY